MPRDLVQSGDCTRAVERVGMRARVQACHVAVWDAASRRDRRQDINDLRMMKILTVQWSHGCVLAATPGLASLRTAASRAAIEPGYFDEVRDR